MPTAFEIDPSQPSLRRSTRAPSPRALRALVWMLGSLAAVTIVKEGAFEYIGGATPFLLYFAAIMAAAWSGGWTGGLLATALSTALGTFFFLPPYWAFIGLDGPGAVRIGVFALEGIAITAITSRLHVERARSRAAAADAGTALAKLEGVLRGVGDGITVQSARGELVYANEAAARMTGFATATALQNAPVEEIMARFEMLTPDGAPFPVAELPGRLALAGMPAPERLVRFRVRATGQERWALIRANPIEMPGADVPHAVNVFQDVTEARAKDEALRLSREQLSTTLNSIGDAVIATDGAGRVTFVNPVAEALTGWEAAAAHGRPLEEVFRIVNEETRAPVESPVAKVLRDGAVVGLANHTVLISRAGTETAIDDSAAPIRATPDETPAGTVLVFRDVSTKRAEEDRRTFMGRAAAELASSLDYRSTLATVARMAVPTLADWCAVDMVGEGGALDRLAVAHVDPAKIELVYDIQRRYPQDPDRPGGTREVARTGKSLFIAEIPEQMLASATSGAEHLRLVRQLQLRSFLAVPMIANGETLGVISLAMAESGRRYGQADVEAATTLADRAALAVHHARLYAQATAARTEAEQASRAKDEFLAMLGHELRNPLAPILTALQLMKLRAPEALERERAVVERQVKHLVTLVDDLLDVARITRGGVELAHEPVDLADVLARALELAGPLIEQRRHQVTTGLARGLVVSGDPLRLAQVLTNLLTNAAKYTDPGGCIEVTGARRHASGGATGGGEEIVVRVSDNGRGIHPDILPRVFDMFVQGGQPLDRAMGGLGLGLTIVRRVVELHGGHVSAASEGPGKGSELTVVLPALAPAAAAAASSLGPAPSRGTTPGSGTIRPGAPGGTDVLVVDDNADALELMAEALDMMGYRPHTAGDAAAAIVLAQQVRPAAGLLDIGLPVMDGYELARRLRATPGLERMPLVAVTGYGQETDRERARAAGFTEHLVKPVSVDDVERVLGRLLGRGGTRSA